MIPPFPALQIPALSLLMDFFPGVLEVSGPSCTLGDRLGEGASLGWGASLDAFLVLRQLLDTSRAGEGSVPVEWTEGLITGLLWVTAILGRTLGTFPTFRRGFRELMQAGRAPPLGRCSHWILKSGGSNLMLETAMWPLSPSSNSTTTESRSSSSSLEAPAIARALSMWPACLARRQGRAGANKDVGMPLQPDYTGHLINQHHCVGHLASEPPIPPLGIHSFPTQTSLCKSSREHPADSCPFAHSPFRP